MNQISVKVVKKTQEAVDIVSLELVTTDGSLLPSFSAGSHIDVHLSNGLIRQYSLCNDPSEQQRYLIGVLRDPNTRGGSAAVHDQLEPGAQLQISAPKNHFELMPAKRSLLFAGGIGVTPILCMADQLAQSDAVYEMHYCSRSPEHTAFHARLLASSFSDRVNFHFDNGDAEQKMALSSLLAKVDADTQIYVCGPAGFIDHVVNTAKSQGWTSAQLHVEHFGAQALEDASDSAFEVKLASTGKVYAIPADKTIIAVLAEHGIELPFSCEQGVCGTCITRVLEGIPDHRDQYFTEDELALNDQFTPCCSRSKSPLLVLDL